MVIDWIKKYYEILICILLLAIYTYLYIHRIDSLGIGLFFFSLLFGFLVIKKKYGRVLVNNTELIFLVFLFLYGFYNPFIAFLSDIMTDSTYKAMLIYASSIPAYLIGVLFIKTTKHPIKEISLKCFSGNALLYCFILLLILFSLLVYMTYFFSSLDMLFNPSTLLGKNRNNFFKHITQIQIVIGLFISGIFLFFIFYFEKLSSKFQILIVILLSYYILMHLSVGNRKDFIPMLLGLMWIVVNKYRISVKISLVTAFLFVIFFFNFLGGIRSMIFRRETFGLEIIKSSIKYNEFTFPINTLIDEVDLYNKNPENYKFRYGKTFFINSFEIFIPRKFFHNKFTSLAKDYMHKFHDQSEYAIAYTPVTESFINFGPFGISIVYFFIGYIISFIANYKIKIFNFLFFCIIIDFCRGEISSIVFIYLFIALPFIMFLLLSRFKLI